jgi:hypothetical protein
MKKTFENTIKYFGLKFFDGQLVRTSIPGR